MLDETPDDDELNELQWRTLGLKLDSQVRSLTACHLELANVGRCILESLDLLADDIHRLRDEVNELKQWQEAMEERAARLSSDELRRLLGLHS